MIEPTGITFFRNAITDEGQARGTQGHQLVGINGNVAGVLAAESGFFRAVLYKVAGHPVVFALRRQILHGFTPVATMQFCAAFTGRPNEDERKPRVIGHRDESSLPVPGDAFDSDFLRIDCLVGLEIIQTTGGSPRPGAQPTPVIRLAELPLVDEPNDALGQPGAIVGLNASGIDRRVTPTSSQQLLLCRRITTCGCSAATSSTSRRLSAGNLRKATTTKHHHDGN